MLAAGTRSAMLAVMSATRGMALWRMARDDVYLGMLLNQISLFYEAYCLVGPAGTVGTVGTAGRAGSHVSALIPPPIPEEVLSAGPEHGAFVRRTAQLAREAQLLDLVAAPARAPGVDRRAFLDG